MTMEMSPVVVIGLDPHKRSVTVEVRPPGQAHPATTTITPQPGAKIRDDSGAGELDETYGLVGDRPGPRSTHEAGSDLPLALAGPASVQPALPARVS